MSIRRVFSLVVLLLCLAALAESQQRRIEYAPVKPTSPASAKRCTPHIAPSATARMARETVQLLRR